MKERSILGPSQTELLAPARDLSGGRLAIDCGADAVYIGAARYGARAAAGNSLSDIEALARYAHRYWARVYVTLNTLLYEHELPAAVQLAHQLYEAGVDALIVQDAGLLESDLPPLPLIASTQMHNDRPDKVAFWEQVGFSRAILARELSLPQIRAIRAQTGIELESFVHGALCVCYSGQCYMSYAVGGRSSNRGECAQPCRRRYTLVGAGSSRPIAEGHLLSLHDLNLSEHLGELLQAGVTSFKIEGRLKDDAYVKNVVRAYRRRLDEALADRGLTQSSSGQSALGIEPEFEPDLDKTFNRGYTSYYLHGNRRGGRQRPGRPETPKMIGEPIGRVTAVGAGGVRLDTVVELHNGDGLAFFIKRSGELCGTFVNGVLTPRGKGGAAFTVEDTTGIRPGTLLYRNHDHEFLGRLEKARVERRIAAWFVLEEGEEGLTLRAEDEDGNRGSALLAWGAQQGKEPARQPEAMRATLERQLARTGDTEFACAGIEVRWSQAWFLPVSAVNDLRRRALDALVEARALKRPMTVGGVLVNEVPYPETRLDYRGNVLNPSAEAFYRRHGVAEIEPAAESGLDLRGREVMRTRYCLRAQLGECLREKPGTDLKDPLYLVDEDGHRYPLRFDCARCEMSVYY